MQQAIQKRFRLGDPVRVVADNRIGVVAGGLLRSGSGWWVQFDDDVDWFADDEIEPVLRS